MRKNERNIEEKGGGVEGEISRINEAQREREKKDRKKCRKKNTE